MSTNNGYDALMVSTAEFLEILQPLIDQQRKLFEFANGSNVMTDTGYEYVSDEFLAPTAYIARVVGIDESGVRRVLKGEQKFLTLRKADEWLTKLNLGHRMRDLRVVPNPHLSHAKWRAYFLGNGDAIPEDVDFSTWSDACG